MTTRKSVLFSISKISFCTVILLFICMSIYAQDSNPTNKPLIYLSRSASLTTGFIGELVTVDALTLKEQYFAKFDDFQIGRIEINEDNTRAYIVGQGKPDASDNALIAYDLINKQIIKRAYNGRNISNAKIGPDGLVYVLLKTEHALEINDQALNVIATIALPESTQTIVFDNGKAFISLQTSMAILDLKSRLITTTFSIPTANNPFFYANDTLALGPNHILYISQGTIVIKLDTSSNTILSQFKNLHEAYNTTLSPDGNTLYRLPSSATLPKHTIYTVDTDSGIELDSITFPKAGFYLDGVKMDKSRNDLLYTTDSDSLYVIDANTHQVITSRSYPLFTNSIFSPLMSGFALTGNFAIGVAPNVSFTDIKEGDILQKGGLFNVTWQPTIGENSFIPVKYSVSLIEGITTEFLTGDDKTNQATNLSGDIVNFMWRVPFQNTSAQLKIVVTDVSGRTGTQLINITIGDKPAGDSQAPSVSFVSPLGSEAFTVGDSLNINWTSSDNVGVVRQDLSLSTDGGNTFPITIATGLRGEVQSFNFTLPDNAVTTNGRLKLVVSDAAGNAAQTVTKDFTIKAKPDNQAPMVTISNPNGQTFLAGQPINVNWQTTDNGTVMSQAISLSLDGGANFTKIKALGATDNSFNLSDLAALTQTTSKAVVEITASDSNGNVGLAMASFSIAPVITMASYSKKVLDVSGLGFLANGSNASYQLMVNGNTVSTFVFSGSNTSFSFKGNKKKLGIVKGNNTVQLLINGEASNSTSFNF